MAASSWLSLPSADSDRLALARAMALAAIPVAFGVALQPHFMRLAVITRSSSGYKNGDPRRQVAEIIAGHDSSLSPEDAKFVSRATGAHLNNLEMFPLFASGVLGAIQARADPFAVRNAAFLYVVARVAYNFIYTGIADDASSWWRDVPFNATGLCCGYLFLKAVLAALQNS